MVAICASLCHWYTQSIGTHKSHLLLSLASCDSSSRTAASASGPWGGGGGETRLRMGIEAMIGDSVYNLM